MLVLFKNEDSVAMDVLLGTPFSNSSIVPLVGFILFYFLQMAQHLDLRCVLISDPSTLGAEAKTRLHTPKAVTYHEQPQYCRFMIGHSLVRVESKIKKFTPHCICRYPQSGGCQISVNPRADATLAHTKADATLAHTKADATLAHTKAVTQEPVLCR